MKRKAILFVIASIVTLAIVHVLFSITAPVNWLQATWSSGDLITYIGTIALGIVAYVQNDKANDMSKRLMQLEENRYKLETRPFVFLSDWNVSNQSSNSIRFERTDAKETICVDIGIGDDEISLKLISISFLLINTTQSCISAQYKGASYACIKEELGWRHSYQGTDNHKLVLCPGQVGRIVFIAQRELFEKTLNRDKITISLILENRFGERYQEDFDATFIFKSNQIDNKNPMLLVDASNYRIGKFYYENGTTELKWENTTNE